MCVSNWEIRLLSVAIQKKRPCEHGTAGLVRCRTNADQIHHQTRFARGSREDNGTNAKPQHIKTPAILHRVTGTDVMKQRMECKPQKLSQRQPAKLCPGTAGTKQESKVYPPVP